MRKLIGHGFIPSVITAENCVFGTANALPFDLLQRRSEGFLYRPMTAIQAQPKRTGWNTNMLCPFSNRFGFFLKGDLYTISSIPRLFPSCSPSAICLRIMAIIIYSFNCSIQLVVLFKMFLIRDIHIIAKFLKRFPKRFDSTSTIKRIFFKVLFITDPIDSKPYFIKMCARKTMRFPQKQITAKPRTKDLLGLNDAS